MDNHSVTPKLTLASSSSNTIDEVDDSESFRQIILGFSNLGKPERRAKQNLKRWEKRLYQIMAVMNEQRLRGEIESEDMASFLAKFRKWEAEGHIYLMNSQSMKWWELAQRSRVDKDFTSQSKDVVMKGKATSKMAALKASRAAIKNKFICNAEHAEFNPDGSCRQCPPSKAAGSPTIAQQSPSSPKESPQSITAGFLFQGGDLKLSTANEHKDHHRRSGLQQLLHRSYSYDASHDSKACDLPKHNPARYTQILKEIMYWIPKGLGNAQGAIWWLHGSDDIANSDLAYYVASFCGAANIRCASFFFSQEDGHRNTVENLVTTLAYQVAKKLREFEDNLDQTIQKDPTLLGKHRKYQQEDLMAALLRETECKRPVKRPVVIVIDGVDQCIRKKDVDEVLDFVAFLSDVPPIRVVLTTGNEVYSQKDFVAPSVKSRTTYHDVDLSHT